jgi:hypothetical protein
VTTARAPVLMPQGLQSSKRWFVLGLHQDEQRIGQGQGQLCLGLPNPSRSQERVRGISEQELEDVGGIVPAAHTIVAPDGVLPEVSEQTLPMPRSSPCSTALMRPRPVRPTESGPALRHRLAPRSDAQPPQPGPGRLRRGARTSSRRCRHLPERVNWPFWGEARMTTALPSRDMAHGQGSEIRRHRAHVTMSSRGPHNRAGR